jgi:hypothetical protein
VFQVLPKKQAIRRNRYYPHALRPAELPSKLGISQAANKLTASHLALTMKNESKEAFCSTDLAFAGGRRMSDSKQEPHRPPTAQRCSESQITPFDFEYTPSADVDPLALLGNAYLSLHHHMAPADGGFDLGADEA